MCVCVQSSLTLSSRQRYFLKHRKGGKTSIYLKGVDKELLKDQNKCTEFIKGLVTEGVYKSWGKSMGQVYGASLWG